MAQTYVVKAGDTLNKIAAQYGFSNYKTAGITGYGSNPDAITPGMQLTIGGGAPATPAPAPVPPTPPVPTTTATAVNSYINGTQQNDIKTAGAKDAPPTSSTVGGVDVDSVVKSLNDLRAPVAPDLTKAYTDLRATYGIDGLETSLNDLNKQKSDLVAASQARTAAEKAKPVAMNVIAGRVSEEEAQDNQRIAAIDSQISTITNQLNTKYNVVDTLMKLTGDDYQNASASYNTQFSQALQLLTYAKGAQAQEQTAAEAAKDDARANLQVIYNGIQSGGVSYDSLDESTKASITKLELQSGLPVGFYNALQNKNPKANIITTSSRENNGQSYTDVVLQNPDGSISVESVYRGASHNESDGTGSGAGNVKAFKFTNDDVGKLQAAGLSQGDISSLQSDINAHGATTALEGLTPAQKKIANQILTGSTATAKGEYLTTDFFKGQFTQSQLIQAAKDAGYASIWKSRDTEVNDYLNHLMDIVAQYRQAGYDDDAILKMMQ